MLGRLLFVKHSIILKAEINSTVGHVSHVAWNVMGLNRSDLRLQPLKATVIYPHIIV